MAGSFDMKKITTMRFSKDWEPRFISEKSNEQTIIVAHRAQVVGIKYAKEG